MSILCRLLVLVTLVVASQALICYECFCPSLNIANCNCDTTSNNNDGTTCVIYELDVDGYPQVQLTRIQLTSTYIDIEDTYLLLGQETIEWNTTRNEWVLETDNVLFACDWDYCNLLEYAAALPKSFQFTIDTTWLNENIRGTGTVNSCYQCADQICGNSSFPVDQNQCPMTTCTGADSCVAGDLWDNLQTGEQCYQSRCWTSSDQGAKQRIYVEGVVYLAKDRNEIDIWELDVYCTVSGCTRVSIFQDILSRLRWNLDGLSVFPPVRPSGSTTRPPTTRPIKVPLRCYSCQCIGTSECPCDQLETTVRDDTYCVIIRELEPTNKFTYLGHLQADSTQLYINEFPYALVEEAIDFNETTRQWTTFTNFVIYGCDWDECNKPELIKFMPESYQLTVPDSWLSYYILGNGTAIRDCHECPDTPQCGTNDFLDSSRCPIRPCNTTCLVTDTFTDPVVGDLCYQSFCLPSDTSFYQYPKHRIEIEAIVYGKRPNDVEIWEIDIFCRADDCSRPEIFKELRGQLQFRPDTLDELFNETNGPNAGKRRCYDCFCYDRPGCDCNVTTDDDARTSYCTIVIEYTGQTSLIFFEHINRNSTAVYIREFPYLLIEESIKYNEGSGRWTTNTNFAVFGCNWDYCNYPGLLQYIPTGFQIRLPEYWLNSSILGNGTAIRDCHECPDAPQCGTTDFLDVARCPIKECNTTCLVSDSFNDPAVGLLCYQSFCAPPDTPQFTIDPHRVEIEAVMYGARPGIVELWEIDLFCRAEDCSRPTLFRELRELLTVQPGNLQQLFNLTIPTVPQRRCYDCICYNTPNCGCNTVVDSPADSTYCTLTIEYNGQTITTRFGHVNRNSTQVYIQDFPYILVEELINFNEQTGRWITSPMFVAYGCNKDYCNNERFLPYLPSSFQLRLSEAWLNTNVLGNGAAIRDCHECPEAPQCGTNDFLDSSRCPIRPCNTTCLVSDSFNDPTSDLLCYQSFCAPADTPQFTIDPHRVEIEAILYLNKVPRAIEIWEIDLFCRADDCSRPQIFRELRSNLTSQYGDLSIFDSETSSRPTIVTTPTTAPTTAPTTPTATPSTPRPPTTTSKGGTSTASSTVVYAMGLQFMLYLASMIFVLRFI